MDALRSFLQRRRLRIQNLAGIHVCFGEHYALILLMIEVNRWQ